MMHLERHLFRADERGASAIEFAFVAGILAVLLIGLVDFGMGFWDKLQVANGARAGAEYAVANPNPYDQTAVEKAASSATYAINISNASASASEVCRCPDATSGLTTPQGGSATPPCTSGTCTNGSVGTYVTVTTQGDYKPIFSWPGLPSPLTFKSTAWVRIN